MPFQTTDVQPVIDAKVTVEFAGQMLLEPGRDDTETSRTCEIGVNRYAPMHKLLVMLVVSKPDTPPTVIPLLRGPLTANFSIGLHPDPGVGDFRVFAPMPPRSDPHDYRWSINIRDIHPNAERNEGADPIVLLKMGTLYAPNLTRDGLDPKFKRQGVEIPLTKVAAALAASIPLVDQTILLQWEELGDPLALQLPRPGDDPETTIYTLSFINDPPLSTAQHDEMAMYYKILANNGQDIPENERWTLEYNNAEKSDEIPCLPARLDP